MGDCTNLAAEEVLGSEFVKFLTLQLKESRDENAVLVKENAGLKAQIEGGLSETKDEASVIEGLKTQLASLQVELDAALGQCKTHEAEASAWKTRYEQLKPQLSYSAAHHADMLEEMRQGLQKALTEQTSNTSATSNADVAKFLTFISSMPNAVTTSEPGDPNVVFKGTKLLPLSKAATKTCVGGPSFFGSFLRWCTPQAQHAYVLVPQYKYTPRNTPQGSASWSAAKDWAGIAGQQRELFYVHDENICYAGTFFCHSGPIYVRVGEIDMEESTIQSLARASFNPTNTSQKVKAKTYTPLLADLYREGTATVQLLGLQRVGFNNALLQILQKSYSRRESARGAEKRSADEMGKSAFGGKGGGGEDGAGPVKVPRLDLDEDEDEMDLELTGPPAYAE